MSLSLSDAELLEIADKLFLLKSPNPSPLSKPTNTTGVNSLAIKLDPIGNDPRFKDIGIGVVDFTSDMMAPRIWLHKGDVPWRIGSTGKIAVLLAAVQLRDDVRKVVAALNGMGKAFTPNDLDDVFSTIWRRSSNTKIKQIARPGSAPRISTIFDITISPPNFFGANIPLDKARLGSIDHLDWSGVPYFSFWERLWLMGALSDNTAAITCISEIGHAYLGAVQRGYGLFNKGIGMHLLTTSFGSPPNTVPVTRASGAPKYRSVSWPEKSEVTDKWHGSNWTTQAGSAAALTAYMIALMQNKLVDIEGCDTIRMHLADETGLTGATARSLILMGVNSSAPVTKAHTKLGILGALRCEFAYLEVGGLKYAIFATGILPKIVGASRYSEIEQGMELGIEIHNILFGP